ncbi:MAG: hypothetical protein JXA30_15790 [Deltaproteobacteria bacterium]|nr:hypothetical protein [Deltaproteobacteria bacterium]
MAVVKGTHLNNHAKVTGMNGWLIVVFVVFINACGHSARPIETEPPSKGVLSASFKLSDWQIDALQEIGYVSLGVQHLARGDKLLVSDIRRKEPSIPKPERVRVKAPELADGAFLISRFDRGNVNHLGGAFNEFYRRPSRAATAIDAALDEERALTLWYDNRKPGYAGLWIHLFQTLDPPHQRVYLDLSEAAYITFSIRGEKGGEPIDLRIADRIWESREDSMLIGSLSDFIPGGRILKNWQPVWLPLDRLPDNVDRTQLAVFALSVGGYGEGRIQIKDLAVTTRKEVAPFVKGAPSPAARTTRKALWLWTTARIIEDAEAQRALIDFCKRERLSDLFMQLPYSARLKDGKWAIRFDEKEMGSLIAKLSRAGVRVDALDGDPRYALEHNHAKVIAVIQALVAYNNRASPERRFRAVRFDIEPYLLPEYGGGKKQDILRQYLNLLRGSRATARRGRLAFAVDIPFWFDERNKFFEKTAELDGRPMSEWVIDTVDSLAIMDYRTKAYGPDGAIAHGRDELEYAAKRGKPVFVGLETVELPDETLLEFARRGRGARVVLRPIREDTVRLDLFSEPEWRKLGAETKQERGILILSQIEQTEVPADKLTFAHRKPSELYNVMDQLELELGHLDSFVGFALHCYESYRPWSSAYGEK